MNRYPITTGMAADQLGVRPPVLNNLIYAAWIVPPQVIGGRRAWSAKNLKEARAALKLKAKEKEKALAKSKKWAHA